MPSLCENCAGDGCQGCEYTGYQQDIDEATKHFLDRLAINA